MRKGEEITSLVPISMDATAWRAVGLVQARTLTPSKQHSKGEESVHLFDSPGRRKQTWVIPPL